MRIHFKTDYEQDVRLFEDRIAMAKYGLLVALALTPSLQAGHPHAIHISNYNRGANWYNANRSWHGPHHHHTWRQPLAVIVPPTAHFQTHYSWGVGRTRMTPLHHQFARPYVDPVTGTNTSAAPRWPSDTSQQGIYYVRGPW